MFLYTVITSRHINLISYLHTQIFILYLIIVINRKYHVCWGGCTVTFCHFLLKDSRKKTVFVSITIVKSMTWVNDRLHYGLKVVFVCLHITPTRYFRYPELPEIIEQKKCQSGLFYRMCVKDYIMSTLLIIFYARYGAVSYYPFCYWWLQEYLYFILLSSSNRQC